MKGLRQPDGSLQATEITATPNGMQAFEKDVIDATNQMEQQWLKAGAVTEQDKDGKTVSMGKLHTSGPEVDRVRNIANRLFPPYLDKSKFRVYVVENKDWNAFACANGMIVVYDSLLKDTNDDEMAIELGHELVHATHELSRKQIKSGMKWAPLGIGAALLGQKSGLGSQAAGAGIALGVGAVQNGYSRDFEDQADIVGLRYAYEGKFDVTQGPKLWDRFAKKYGDSDKVTNVLFGNHSRAVDRARNLTQQIAWNYATK
jgi:Zn-dependent protease with chaperone function